MVNNTAARMFLLNDTDRGLVMRSGRTVETPESGTYMTATPPRTNCGD